MMTPYFLAVVGGSACGKTELARALVESLPAGRAALLQEDDYYHCSSRFPGFDPAAYNFDEPAAKEQSLMAAHLVLLRMGQTVDMPEYDFVTHQRLPRATVVRPAPLVVAEGLHLLASPVLAAAFDASIFVDTPAAVRLERRLRRDVAERGRTPEAVAHQFTTVVEPMHALHVEPQRARASLTVSGLDPVDALVSLARSLLPERLKA